MDCHKSLCVQTSLFFLQQQNLDYDVQLRFPQSIFHLLGNGFWLNSAFVCMKADPAMTKSVALEPMEIT